MWNILLKHRRLNMSNKDCWICHKRDVSRFNIFAIKTLHLSRIGSILLLASIIWFPLTESYLTADLSECKINSCNERDFTAWTADVNHNRFNQDYSNLRFRFEIHKLELRLLYADLMFLFKIINPLTVWTKFHKVVQMYAGKSSQWFFL